MQEGEGPWLVGWLGRDLALARNLAPFGSPLDCSPLATWVFSTRCSTNPPDHIPPQNQRPLYPPPPPPPPPPRNPDNTSPLPARPRTTALSHTQISAENGSLSFKAKVLKPH